MSTFSVQYRNGRQVSPLPLSRKREHTMHYDPQLGVKPWRDVVKTEIRYTGECFGVQCSLRFDTLSCGHTTIKKGSRPAAKRRRCESCDWTPA